MMATSLPELHDMAQKIGLRRDWFQDHPVHPHYDMTSGKRKLAIELGAIEVTSQEMLVKCSTGDR
jgi:hypothetical protein